MKFDPPLAKAELNRASLLLSHHLRQIEIDDDAETAAYFNTVLWRLASQAEKGLVRCKVKRRMGGDAKENIAMHGIL